MNSLKLEWFKLVKRVKIRGENKNKYVFSFHFDILKKPHLQLEYVEHFKLVMLFICINAFILNFGGKWNKFNSVKLEQRETKIEVKSLKPQSVIFGFYFDI